MKLALLVFILFPLISFAQTEQKLIPEFEVSSGKLSNIVPQVLEELNLTYIIGAVNLPKRKEIRQHTFVNATVQEILDYLHCGEGNSTLQEEEGHQVRRCYAKLHFGRAEELEEQSELLGRIL